jgi:hypothetical protein
MVLYIKSMPNYICKGGVVFIILLLAVSCTKPADTSPRIPPMDADADYCLDLGRENLYPRVRLVKKHRNLEPALIYMPEKPYYCKCNSNIRCSCRIDTYTENYFYFFGETEDDRYDEHGWGVIGWDCGFHQIIDGIDGWEDIFDVSFDISPVAQIINFPKSEVIRLKRGRENEDLLQFKNKVIDAEIHKSFSCDTNVAYNVIKFRARITGECEQKKNIWSQPPWNIGAISEDSVVAEPGSDGALVVRGNGRMMDFEDNNRPWLKMCNEEITKIIVESGVTHIGDFAFMNCSALTSATIGSSVNFIYKGAFKGCEKLSSITILNSAPPSLHDNDSWEEREKSTAFEGVNKEACTLYVPEGSVDAYRKADGWKEFVNIKAIE